MGVDQTTWLDSRVDTDCEYCGEPMNEEHGTIHRRCLEMHRAEVLREQEREFGQ